MHKLLAVLALLVGLIAGPVAAADEPIVAVWLNRHSMMKGEAQIVSFMNDSKARGVTHVMPNFWFHGYLIYPGSPLAPQHPDFCGWDPMAVVVREAHARGIKVWPWSEYGFFTHYNKDLDEKDCGWILTHHPEWKVADEAGSIGLVNDGMGVMHFSMNPAHPGARAFLIQLHLDIARRYDIDGINTDRVRYMNEKWGFDAFSNAEFAKWAAQQPADAPKDRDTWRRAVITSFADEFATAWRAANPGKPITAAVNPPSMYRAKFQYFDDWARDGNLDYAAPMIYGSADYMKKELAATKEMLPPGTPIIAGIDAGQGEEGFAVLVDGARELGAAGVAIWDDSSWSKLTYSFAAKKEEAPASPPQ